MLDVTMTQRVYVAIPKALYGTAHHRRSLATVHKAYPNAEVLDPATLFDSHEDWLQRWPSIAKSLDVFVLVPNSDGIIGAGCYEEYRVTRALGVPQRLLKTTIDRTASGQTTAVVRDGRFVDVFHARKLSRGIDLRRYAIVVSGRGLRTLRRSAAQALARPSRSIIGVDTQVSSGRAQPRLPAT